MGTRINLFIEQLRETGESEFLEAKTYKDKIGSKSLLESISAFSNTNGGIILIGIGPHPDYKITGVSDFDKIESEISSLCANEFNIRPNVNIKKDIIEECNIVLLEIKKTTQPLYLKNRPTKDAYYVRIGNSTITADNEDIKRLYDSSNDSDFELSPVRDCSIDDIDDEIIDMYKHLRSQVDEKASELKLNKFDFLKALNCTTNDKINNLGIICFGKESAYERHFTSCYIDYIISNSNQWISDLTYRFDNKFKIGKSIIVQRIEIQDLINKHINKIFAHVKDIESEELPVIPNNAIDETLTNAIMHRDYSSKSSIQILQYVNRIEFKNPGYSLKSIETIKDSGSYPRNPKLCSIFEKIRYCETVGSGIKIIMEAMRKHNLDEPVIDSNRPNNAYAITFFYKHLLDDSTLDHLRSFVNRHNLLNIESTALAYLWKTGSINNEIFRQINNVDIYTASESLKRLVKMNLVTNKGTSKKDSVYEPTQYFLDGK